MDPKRILPFIVAVGVALPALVAAQQTVYRWVDKDGKVHFSDTPPPKDIEKSTQRRVGGGFSDNSQLPYATQQAMRRSPVVLYAGGDCGDPCVQGRALLAKRGIPYGEKDAQTNAADSEALKKLAGGLFVPTLAVGDNPVKGYSEASWHAALDAAGYPRSVLPGQIPPTPPPAAKKPDPAPPPAAEAAPAAEPK